MQTFEELSDIFSDHNNYLTSRELLMRVSSGRSFYFISEGTVKLLIITFNIICKNPSFKVCFFCLFCLLYRKALQSLPVWRVVPRSTRNAPTRDSSCRRKW